MNERCSYQGHCRYHRYGGRGITVCEEWRNNFTAFAAWAASSGYADGLTLDRVDNDGNYEPANCRWVTNRENCRNREFSPENRAATGDRLREAAANANLLRGCGGKAKAVFCASNGKTYISATAASRDLGLIRRSVCKAACCDLTQTGGYTFQYV